MGICWSWAWGPESGQATYQNDLQWGSYSNSIISETAADYLYSYTGSPTRYSAGFRGDNGAIMRPPDKAVANWQPGSGGTELQGWVATPIKRDGLTYATSSRPVITIQSVDPGFGSTAQVLSLNGSGVLRLYLSGTFIGSSADFDLSVWRYLALKWDMTTTTHTAEFFVDGVSQVSGSLAGRTQPINSVYFTLGAVGSFNNRWLIGQIICYDDATDAGQTPYYVTRVSPNADGTNVGAWTASSGGADYVDVTDPFDAATYTQEAGPSPNDLVEVLINAGGNDIGTQLGITPSSVQNVTLHTYSTGQLITARAELRDSAGSGSATVGPTETIDTTSTTYAAVSADAPAGGGSWTGASQPAFVYKVITT